MVLSSDGGTGLARVPAGGDQASSGLPLLHHKPLLLRCQMRSPSLASSTTLRVVESTTPLTATRPWAMDQRLPNLSVTKRPVPAMITLASIGIARFRCRDRCGFVHRNRNAGFAQSV